MSTTRTSLGRYGCFWAYLIFEKWNNSFNVNDNHSVHKIHPIVVVKGSEMVSIVLQIKCYNYTTTICIKL